VARQKKLASELTGLPRPPQRSNSDPDLATRQLVEELRRSQAELQTQNLALRFSQQAAEGASERFVALFSNVPLALMVVDARGQILEHNGRALDLLRPREDDPPLTYLLPLVLAAHRARVEQGLAQAAQQGVCEISELQLQNGSRATITGDLHIASLDSPQDDAASFICAVIDQGPLLAQRQALQDSANTLQQRNQALSESQSRLAAIIDSSLDAIVCVDPQLNITVFNPAATRLFDCPQHAALGVPLAQLLPSAAWSLRQPGSRPRHAQLGEMQGLTPGGAALPLEVSMSFEPHVAGDIITLFVRDLRPGKQFEAQRSALEAQLRESQKMQAIGTLAGGIAHDFNNIISAILGNATLAREDADPGSALGASLTEIDKAARRARDLVRQILTFSRNDPPRRQSVQLADVVRETLHLFKVTLPPGIALLTRLEADTPPVWADPTQVEQVLLNLCTNAMHAIGERPGQITVKLGLAPAGEGKAQVRLQVHDTGIGMDAATQERIFEPFFTTKPVGQGTGLGLSVVHGIMQAHEGQVQVHSAPGHGSTFTLLFALTQAQPATAAPTALPCITQGQGQRVMYVDDDEALVFLVKRVLTRKGYAVLTHADPRQAIAALRADPLQCDLLVTDYNMPGYSGLDLLRDVLALRPDLPVALASGYVTPDIEQAALAAGARALIHKPNDVEEMCATVRLLLAEPPQGA